MRQSRMIGLCAALVGVVTSASAGDMSGMYGNTVVCSYADGRVTKVHTESGGKFTVVRGGQTIQGTWVDDGSNACYNETNPAPPAGTKPVCASSALKKVGDSWTVTDPVGGVCNAVLTAGKQ